MAVTYTGATGLMKHLGALIARIDSYLTLGLTTLPADSLALRTAFGATWLPHEGIAAYYEGLRRDVAGWRQGLAGYGDRRLTDADLVLTPLGLPEGSGFGSVLPALWRDMQDGGHRVKASSCALGAVTAASGNRGDGTAWPTLILDGWNAPLAGGQALTYYDGLASQLCVPSETMTLECVADSATDGMPEGGEAWSWTGGPSHAPLDVRTEGSGQGPGLYTSDGEGLLSGGGLDSWSGSVPSGWTVEAGSVTQDTSVYRRGGSSAKVTGGGGTVRLVQSLASGLLQGRRRYATGLAVLASGTTSGATVRAYLRGTGHPAFAECSLDGGSLSTSWQALGGGGSVPVPTPTDLEMVLEVSGLPSGSTVWLDDVRLAPVAYHGGVGLTISAGPTPWVRGDRLTFTVTNDQAGLFQDYWRKWYSAMLPSIATGLDQGYFLGLPFTLMEATTAATVPDSLVA